MITVDNLEVAQFICLLLHNGKIREVIGHHHLQSSADPGPLYT
jgi:hypothetical protein